MGDSCDASGETEDDDQYERRSSCDQTVTMIGSSRDNGIDISPTTEESKVMITRFVLLSLRYHDRLIVFHNRYFCAASSARSCCAPSVPRENRDRSACPHCRISASSHRRSGRPKARCPLCTRR